MLCWEDEGCCTGHSRVDKPGVVGIFLSAVSSSHAPSGPHGKMVCIHHGYCEGQQGPQILVGTTETFSVRSTATTSEHVASLKLAGSACCFLHALAALCQSLCTATMRQNRQTSEQNQNGSPVSLQPAAAIGVEHLSE